MFSDALFTVKIRGRFLQFMYLELSKLVTMRGGKKALKIVAKAVTTSNKLTIYFTFTCHLFNT